MVGYSLKFIKYFSCLFYARSSRHEFGSIFGDMLSYLPSNVGNEGRLLIIFAILSIMFLTLALISVYNFVISYTVFLLICFIILFPLMIFFNYKLFTIARKYGRNRRISSGMIRTFSWKNISSCMLAVACFAVLSIPTCVYIWLRLTSIYSSKELTTCTCQAKLARLWSTTIFSMNSTFNCLIFFWKNKILRTEGMKIIKGLKVSRRDQS